ncbi:MAG: hypothetical protein Q9192_008776, partial [Flavoplaca navasiana]
VCDFSGFRGRRGRECGWADEESDGWTGRRGESGGKVREGLEDWEAKLTGAENEDA